MSRRKILLADDSITIQKVVNLTFADEGIDVITVGDGDAALESLSAEVPDILLADVNMPGPTGYEICERLRQNEATRDLPVILLVGSFEPFDEAEASRVGANAYLTKPFQSIKQLIEQVNELIDASKKFEAEAETAADHPSPEETPSTTSAETLPLPAIDAVPEVPDSSAQTVELVQGEETSQPNEASAEPKYFDDLGYASSVPPVERASNPPADDIDGLYKLSLSSEGQADLSEIGIDDEILETSYTSDDVPQNSFEAAVQFPVEEQASGDVQGQQLENAEAGYPGVESDPISHSELGSISGFHQTAPEDPSRLENTIAYENWQPVDMRGDQTAPLRPAPVEHSDMVEQADPMTLPEAQSNAESMQPASDPASLGEDTIPMAGRFDTAGSAQYQFDDTDLLDLNPTGERSIEITSPSDAREKGSSSQLVTLSPELIEMIAQRVVEKLSEKY